MLPEIVDTYLRKYALRGWEIEPAELENIAAVIVIPAIREYENIRKLLNSLAENDQKYFNSTLIILVINNSILSSDQIKEDNKKSLHLLNSIIDHDISTNDELILKVLNTGLKIGFIDASSPGKELPQKDAGVGIARKIGMDLALIAFDYNSPLKKIIVCLDADCTVDNNYITEIVNNFNSMDLSAAVVNYEHRTGDEDNETAAIVCYEIFLRYYELGLMYAHSPFAFPTIGSTMACTYESYVKSEGMNKRKAAEDFYFLEKLAKNYTIGRIKTTTVYPSSRRSWRVPFGTGQRINRFFAGVQDEYLLYDPKCFYILKEWLKLFMIETQNPAPSLLKAAKEINESLFTFLISQKFEVDWQKILDNSKTVEQVQKQKIRWFDGFRTLKLIHYLRDNGYPMINMFNALDILLAEYKIALPEGKYSSIDGADKIIPDIKFQKKYLEILRTQLFC
jgi:glycosyltransferase involved in cell wall biosynthesis